LNVGHKGVDIIDNPPGPMRTDANTGSTPDTLVKIETDMIVVTAVITKPCRAIASALIAFDAFYFVNVDDER